MKPNQEITREECDRQYVTGERQTLNHRIEISDELYQKLEAYRKEHKLSGIGAACELYIEKLIKRKKRK